MNSLLSRKFILTVLVLLLSYGLVFAGKLDSKTWFEFATIGIGLYSTANVISKFTK